MGIDFSKSPKGATHYAHVLGSKDDTAFYRITKDEMFLFDSNNNWGEGVGYVLIESTQNDLLPIPKPLTVTCDNERQKMLCDQVVRMCRGEASQFKRTSINKWEDKVPASELYTNIEYRAKPKKELVVPWEWIADEYDSFTIRKNGAMYAYNGNNIIHQVEVCGLKLDLAGIELPVTVERPKC